MSFKRSTPEAHGVSSEAILGFLDGIDKAGLEHHSLMVLRNGEILAEGWWSPYGPDKIHLLYSLSKSFTATGIGLAVEEGLLSLDDKVTSFFPDKLPSAISEHLDAMTVHHLISMGTGHREDTLERAFEAFPNDPVKGFLSIAPDEAPGSIFCYNNGATFMLSAIIQEITGTKLRDFLEPRLFNPLGIDKKYWQETPQGTTLGFSGLHITTESIAKLGQLYLQKGVWQGSRLLSETWVERASQKHIENKGTSDNTDWQQGYGYQFWRCQHNNYRGDGAFGQYCVIMPEHEALVVITSAVDNMQPTLDLVWEHLLPAMQAKPLAENPGAHQELTKRLANARLEPVTGQSKTALSEKISGKTFAIEPYQEEMGRAALPQLSEIKFNFAETSWTLELLSQEERHLINGSYNKDLAGLSSYGLLPDTKVSVSGAWTSDTSFSLLLRIIETPHNLKMTFAFKDDRVTIQRRWNVSFGPLELPELRGKQL